MKRIGLVGTENSHTDHFIRFLNSEGRHVGFRAIALAGGNSERNSSLAQTGGIETIVDGSEDLIGVVDAAIISTRDGALHRNQALPLLAAGIPLLVDKPLATNEADAHAIIAAAAEANIPLVSTSALRYLPGVQELAARVAEHGPPEHLHVVGSADPASPYSGLFFYGIHLVEAALQILGDPIEQIAGLEVRSRDRTILASFDLADTTVTLIFVAPDGGEQVPFHATMTSSDRVLTRELTLDADYNAPTLATFIDALATGRWPMPPAALQQPVAILSAIVQARSELSS